MLTPTVHLTTLNFFKENTLADNSRLIIDSFVKSCLTLDASIFEPFMGEENIFEDKTKYLFLAGLKSLFDSYKNKKLVSINITVEEGTCAGCNYGKFVKIFSVTGRGRLIFSDRFAYVIERDNGILADIYRCNLFCSDTHKRNDSC